MPEPEEYNAVHYVHTSRGKIFNGEGQSVDRVIYVEDKLLLVAPGIDNWTRVNLSSDTGSAFHRCARRVFDGTERSDGINSYMVERFTVKAEVLEQLVRAFEVEERAVQDRRHVLLQALPPGSF